jgi:hypothetical protein
MKGAVVERCELSNSHRSNPGGVMIGLMSATVSLVEVAGEEAEMYSTAPRRTVGFETDTRRSRLHVLAYPSGKYKKGMSLSIR